MLMKMLKPGINGTRGTWKAFDHWSKSNHDAALLFAECTKEEITVRREPLNE
jgi:hypothetical protein